MGSYLLIDDAARQSIAKANAAAAAQITPHDVFKRETTLMHYFGSTMSGIPKVSSSVVIAYGHVATIHLTELQPGRPFRHLCVSSPGDGPDPVHVALIAQAFGFKRPLGACKIWATVMPGNRHSLNVLEPCDDGAWSEAAVLDALKVAI